VAQTQAQEVVPTPGADR